MSAPGITFLLLGGQLAAEHASELQKLHAEVYAEPPYRRADDAGQFARRFAVQRRQPGFVMAEARHGGYLVGYASGMPLRPSTSWWRGLTAPLPAEVTTERPGRTFALADRPEERAALTVLPSAAAARHAFRAWGWRKVARTRDPGPGSPVCDVLLITLPAGPATR